MEPMERGLCFQKKVFLGNMEIQYVENQTGPPLEEILSEMYMLGFYDKMAQGMGRSKEDRME